MQKEHDARYYKRQTLELMHLAETKYKAFLKLIRGSERYALVAQLSDTNLQAAQGLHEQALEAFALYRELEPASPDNAHFVEVVGKLLGYESKELALAQLEAEAENAEEE